MGEKRTKKGNQSCLNYIVAAVLVKLAGLEGGDLEVRQTVRGLQTAAVWPLFIQPSLLKHDLDRGEGGGPPS